MLIRPFGRIVGIGGSVTELGFCDDHPSLRNAVLAGGIDAVMSSCEIGFSEFGAEADFLVDQLEVDRQFIESQAVWNRNHNDRVTLLGFRPSRTVTSLRGLVLLPYGGSEPGRGCVSYRPFESRRPSRDFYYNVAHEAFRIACSQMGARRLWMMNPAAPWSFHKDIAMCVCEALGHWCDANPDFAPHSVVFAVGPDDFGDRAPGMRPRDFAGVSDLIVEGQLTAHRPIGIEIVSVDFGPHSRVEQTHLNWWDAADSSPSA